MVSVSATRARAAAATRLSNHHIGVAGKPEWTVVAIRWETRRVAAKSGARFARATTATKARAVGPAAERRRAVQAIQPGKWERVMYVWLNSWAVTDVVVPVVVLKRSRRRRIEV